MSRGRAIRAFVWEEAGRWRARIDGRDGRTISAASRGAVLSRLRRAAGDASLTVETLPRLAGVAEAAAIMGWDKRRVFTYISRGRFPEPVALLASGRVWRREDVEDYAKQYRARNRPKRRRRA